MHVGFRWLISAKVLDYLFSTRMEVPYLIMSASRGPLLVNATTGLVVIACRILPFWTAKIYSPFLLYTPRHHGLMGPA